MVIGRVELWTASVAAAQSVPVTSIVRGGHSPAAIASWEGGASVGIVEMVRGVVSPVFRAVAVAPTSLLG